jgi:hypothetical protein
MSFYRSLPFEAEIISGRLQDGEFLHAAAVHRYTITTNSSGLALVSEQTNDDNDDGIPDGRWDTWSAEYPSVEAALEHTGKCRVGISGVICTVTLDGKEVR